ncbi:MAG: YggS family pyridoxal phosphate-dependent enzyme [Acidiferrobacterales bacterium]
MIHPTSTLEARTADIADNLERVRHAISDAAAAAGRNPRDVRLIAVSKTMPAVNVEAAACAGQIEFGENTMQDALTKIPVLRKRGLTWHFIGHLQTNKVKFVPGHFAWVHSVDRLTLAQKLSLACERAGARLNTLVQVNVTGDPNKHGIAPKSTPAFIDQLIDANLPALELCGLMTMGPYQADEHALQGCFARLRTLFEECRGRLSLPKFTELSMGMTDDFRIAIAEGATMVRIGTAIFGHRAYKTPKT